MTFQTESHNIDLSNRSWRDENLDTLETWHPAFFEVHPECESIVQSFQAVMERYRDILLDTCNDSPDNLQNHVHEEVIMWMTNKLQSTVQDVWKTID